MRRLALLVPAVLCLAGSAPAQEWQIDGAHSAAQFSVRHLMVTTVRGQFGKISGSAVYDPANVAKSSIVAEVQVDSIDTREPKRDAHLKSADFFDAAKYPTVRFQSKSVEPGGAGRFKLIGDLTIRGVTRQVAFDVEGLATPIKDGRGGERTGATASTKISRKDFGMTWNRALEAGGVTVSDEVALMIDLELVRKLAAN
ncbi:MAG TPA: YceI family protein [Bryobacteraceae bacterium]|nr:YceI family protein [Bryobacteraceae bacterium]